MAFYRLLAAPSSIIMAHRTDLAAPCHISLLVMSACFLSCLPCLSVTTNLPCIIHHLFIAPTNRYQHNTMTCHVLYE